MIMCLSGDVRTHHMCYPTITCPNFTSYISHVLSHSHMHESKNKWSQKLYSIHDTKGHVIIRIGLCPCVVSEDLSHDVILGHHQLPCMFSIVCVMCPATACLHTTKSDSSCPWGCTCTPYLVLWLCMCLCHVSACMVPYIPWWTVLVRTIVLVVTLSPSVCLT